jgi:Fur family transcriptional regulator, peroxide stress response regulator
MEMITIYLNSFQYLIQFNMDPLIETIKEQLKNKDVRPSYQRVKVLEYLYNAGGHPTVDEIFRALSPDIPSLSKVTIYNTLHTLVEAGLVRVVDIDEKEKRFDITLANHGHFQCIACGIIYNFQVDFDRISFSGLNRFEITQKNIYFKGLCPNCQTRR